MVSSKKSAATRPNCDQRESGTCQNSTVSATGLAALAAIDGAALFTISSCGKAAKSLPRVASVGRCASVAKASTPAGRNEIHNQCRRGWGRPENLDGQVKIAESE